MPRVGVEKSLFNEGVIATFMTKMWGNNTVPSTVFFPLPSKSHRDTNRFKSQSDRVLVAIPAAGFRGERRVVLGF